jgi:hypothetical protein
MVTCIGPFISGTGGLVVTWPVHVPARPFRRSNESCPSACAGSASGLADAFCAKAARHGEKAAMQSTNRNDLTAKILKKVVIALPPPFLQRIAGRVDSAARAILEVDLVLISSIR